MAYRTLYNLSVAESTKILINKPVRDRIESFVDLVVEQLGHGHQTVPTYIL